MRAEGEGSLYTTDLSGTSFVAVGFWIDGEWKDLKVKGNYATTIAIDRNREGEEESYFTVDTPYGKGARIAYVPHRSFGCVERIAASPYFDLVVVGNKLFAGRMDEDFDIINLDTYSVSTVDVEGAAINVKYFEGKIFVATEKGGNRNTDMRFEWKLR